MPVSAEIFSVDTVQIEPVSQAFRTGQLNMSSVPLEVPVIAKGWSDLPVNWITIAVCTIAVIIFLNSFIGLIPYILGGFLRWKEIVHLENSVGLTRDRNTIAIIAFLIIVLVVSRFEIYSPNYLLLLSPDLRTLGILGAFVIFFFLRECIIILVSISARNPDQYRVANRAIYNFMIFVAVLLVAVIVIARVFGASYIVARISIIVALALSYIVFLIRKTQIMSNACGQVAAFLYLCSLELLPAGLLIASNFVF